MKRLILPSTLAATLALFSACEPTQRPQQRKPSGFHETQTLSEKPKHDDGEENPERTDKPERPEKPKPGFVTSPHGGSGYIDARGFPPGTEVKDPYSGKTFLVP